MIVEASKIVRKIDLTISEKRLRKKENLFDHLQNIILKFTEN